MTNSISGEEDGWTMLSSRTRPPTLNLLLRMSWSWKLLRMMTYKSSDADEGQGVGPKATSLELASPGADVDRFGVGRTVKGSGEEVESEGDVGI
ncbi:vacuolar iron transporter 4-like [Pyrus ussuriensis x Pyrus communis]|uniref:Vacuolar iron transporter 4-like n=1 Tax=Pyrus ussuriensis x Pyrus communis TaxID=2448454 RepID=A0A5N5HJN5_9ROSA|nr:vacuolar iron transporter 4-like [Pyrus ussuriensis x Pyrus communis]